MTKANNNATIFIVMTLFIGFFIVFVVTAVEHFSDKPPTSVTIYGANINTVNKDHCMYWEDSSGRYIKGMFDAATYNTLTQRFTQVVCRGGVITIPPESVDLSN